MDRLAIAILRGAGLLALALPVVGVVGLFLWSISPLPPDTLPTDPAFTARLLIAQNLCWLGACAGTLGLIGFAACWAWALAAELVVHHLPPA